MTSSESEEFAEVMDDAAVEGLLIRVQCLESEQKPESNLSEWPLFTGQPR